MPQVELPLSGDVSQVINPWSWLTQNSQIGLVNVRLGLSMDPGLERQILHNVGSYGRQIGRLSEVLAILVAKTGLLARDDLTHSEMAAIHDFLGQVEAVKSLKERRKVSAAPPGRTA
jgi:hypothetical protein